MSLGIHHAIDSGSDIFNVSGYWLCSRGQLTFVNYIAPIDTHFMTESAEQQPLDVINNGMRQFLVFLTKIKLDAFISVLPIPVFFETYLLSLAV